MNTIKLSYFILVVFLAGCQEFGYVHKPSSSSDPIYKLLENASVSQLPKSERCKRIRMDLREDCRKRIRKQTEELAEAMKNKKIN